VKIPYLESPGFIPNEAEKVTDTGFRCLETLVVVLDCSDVRFFHLKFSFFIAAVFEINAVGRATCLKLLAQLVPASKSAVLISFIN